MVTAEGEKNPWGDDFLDRARGALSEVFGFADFRQGQVEVLEAISGGRDTVVLMPTGSGKSLCYQVPALVAPGVTLVVSPLIALMKDQVDNLGLRGVPVTCINSSIPLEEQWRRLDALREGAYRLVYVAPERFRNRAFRRALEGLEVSLLAIDEAHCISQWGHDFRPDYRRLARVREILGGVQVVALTATATPQVREDIVSELAMDDPAVIVTGFDRPNLTFSVQKVRGEGQKRDALVDFIARRLDPPEGAAEDDGGGEPVPSGIVYVGTRKHAEEVADLLRPVIPTREGRSIRAYHAGLEADERREVQEEFMSGRLPWVVATNAFGMGVDKADIRYVIHYDLPGSVEAYYQEVGRAGRDDEPSECRLLFSSGDRYLQEFFIEGSNPSRETVESVYAFLWQQGQNPLFRSLAELHDDFKHAGLPGAERSSGMAFRSAVVVAERAGALERLDHSENLAELRPVTGRDWSRNPFPQAPVKKVIWAALRDIFEQTDPEPARLHLESWGEGLELQAESLRRGLSQLAQEGWIEYIPPFRGRAIRLQAPWKPLEEHGVDFEALAERRRRDEERLEHMMRFARSWECRRNLVLRHFGEPEPGEGCGRCDVCQAGQRPRASDQALRPLEEHELLVVRKILSGVARARGRCGRGRIIGMLVGSRARNVLENGFEKLSTYGILAHLKKDVVRDLLDQLEVAGCLRQTADRYPRVHLTELGVDVMRGEQSIELAFPRISLARPAGPSEAFDDGVEDDAYDEELFQRLREVRHEIAREQKVPAYRVFSDRTLKAMARFKPRDEGALLGVPGVGKRTLRLFGEEFLDEIRTWS